MSKSKYDPIPTTAQSLKEEGLDDVGECRRNLRMFDMFGHTLYLRKLAISAKMAADRLDRAEHLQGNTLEEYVEVEKKT